MATPFTPPQSPDMSQLQAQIVQAETRRAELGEQLKEAQGQALASNLSRNQKRLLVAQTRLLESLLDSVSLELQQLTSRQSAATSAVLEEVNRANFEAECAYRRLKYSDPGKATKRRGYWTNKLGSLPQSAIDHVGEGFSSVTLNKWREINTAIVTLLGTMATLTDEQLQVEAEDILIKFRPLLYAEISGIDINRTDMINIFVSSIRDLPKNQQSMIK
jgi:hypothetical protein